MPGQLTTQEIFQVSPDGAYLAYAAGDVLRVRAADGGERTIADYQPHGVMRFSPDGGYLAAVDDLSDFPLTGQACTLLPR